MTVREMTSGPVGTLSAEIPAEPTHVFCDVTNTRSLEEALLRLSGGAGMLLHLVGVPGASSPDPIPLALNQPRRVSMDDEAAGS